MDPNSQNQRWSFWEYVIYPDGTRKADFVSVKLSCARFGKLIFGSASQMHVRHATDDKGVAFWEVKVLTEGHPVHDPKYADWIHVQWRRLFQNGFGPRSDIRCHARLCAGDRQDGAPADQLIIIPSIIEPNFNLEN
jgi:hypothetical protein